MTGGLILREDYWDDPEARLAFKEFLRHIHGLDLTRWEECGYWDRLYRPFSYFDATGRVVASVCLYTMKLQVRGRPCRAAQISGVGTLGELRRRGLNRALSEAALAWAEPTHDFVFLFADRAAEGFYERLGFLRAPESQPYAAIQGREARGSLRKLDMSLAADRELVWQYANERAPVSDELGVRNERLLMFHALHTMAGHLYSIPELELIVSFRRDAGRLELHDVIGRCIPDFAELYPFVAGPQLREATFCFMPDKLKVSGLQWRAHPDSGTFDRGDIPLRGQPYLFPFSARA